VKVKKAEAVIRQVWGISKWRFTGEWEKRIWLCKKLVGTVMEFGVEVYGWREGREVMQGRGNARKVDQMDARSGLVYAGILGEGEIGKDIFRVRAGRRAVGFEKKLEKGRGGILARKCLEELRKGISERGRLSGWEEERNSLRTGEKK